MTIELNKTYFKEIENFTFGELSKELLTELFKDGRTTSRFMEKLATFWFPELTNVDVKQVIDVLLNNASKAKNMIKNLIDNFESHIDPNDPTNNCLDVAIITSPEKRSEKTIKKLKNIAGRVLNK